MKVANSQSERASNGHYPQFISSILLTEKISLYCILTLKEVTERQNENIHFNRICSTGLRRGRWAVDEELVKMKRSTPVRNLRNK